MFVQPFGIFKTNRYKQININHMKKKLINTALAFVTALMFVVIGCNKAKEEVVAASDPQYEAELVVNNVDVIYNTVEIAGGTETEEFSSPNEGLPEAYTIIETDMDESGFKRNIEKRIFTCLKKLNLTDAQVASLRKAVRAYEECKAADIKKHREAYASIQTRTENVRKEYLAQLKNGKITKEQFEAKMKDLRALYEKSLKEIKLSFAKNLRACHERFMILVKSTLTEKQWRAFMECYK